MSGPPHDEPCSGSHDTPDAESYRDSLDELHSDVQRNAAEKDRHAGAEEGRGPLGRRGLVGHAAPATWAEVGRSLSMTPQGAHKAYTGMFDQLEGK